MYFMNESVVQVIDEADLGIIGIKLTSLFPFQLAQQYLHSRW